MLSSSELVMDEEIVNNFDSFKLIKLNELIVRCIFNFISVRKES